MYPRLLIDLKKIGENTKFVVDICKKNNIDIMTVTKVFCGNKKIAETQIKSGVKYLADSRIENLIKLKDFDIEKVLLRLPMISKANDVVTYADISLNSEIETIKALNTAAKLINKKHKIILMIDLGDLREGILPKNIDITVEEILKLENIILFGVGVNLTCYGGVIPDEKNLGELIELSEYIMDKYNLSLEIISGGNSSSYYLLPKNRMPKKINNLRFGELIVLGRETAYGNLIDEMHQDAFVFEGEIIELKEKESIPIGQIGMNAFGETPIYVDKGIRKRAIIAGGVQDLNFENLIPYDKNIEIFGASSDHMICDVTDAKEDYKVGDIIKFKLEYGALLKLFTSEYINKKFI